MKYDQRMGKNLEVLVESHRLAQERREAGKSIWDRRIHVYLNQLVSFEERRDAWVRALRGSSWVKNEEVEYSDLLSFVDELAETVDGNEFDLVVDEIYDLADLDRVLITVHR